MAVRKRKVRQWAIKLNDGRFTSPETLVWKLWQEESLRRSEGSISRRLTSIAANIMKESITHPLPQRLSRQDAT
eukprot:11855934-Heterocapsa_arctica.AAC.1